MIYLKRFQTNADYQTFKGDIDWTTPNVSVIENDDIVKYNRYVKPYLTFKTIEDSTFKFTKNACEYSLDEGKTWVSLPAETNTPTVPADSSIMFKATNPYNDGIMGIGTFSSTGKFNVEGNIMSMIYGDDFVDKNDLTKAYTFLGLFISCTNLIDASNLYLPATTLASGCYAGMFEGCTSLTSAPELPATTLVQNCYSDMFSGCTSLTTAPELPATTLADSCYRGMFRGCTSLTTAPELPATTLTSYCYSSMFSGCTGLTTTPELPATTLLDSCYSSMFSGCTGLTTAPELPATTLLDSCYYNMFKGCSSLNNIVMLATDINATKSLENWVDGVASTGTFTKHKDMTSLPTGASGIPSGWEVKNHIIPTECTSLTITADDVTGNDTTTTIHYTGVCNGVDYKGNTVTGFIEEGTVVSDAFPQNTSETETVERTITFEFFGATASTVITQGVFIYPAPQYLTFKTLEDSTFKLTQNACEYSLDEGETWVSLPAETNTPTVPAGSSIMFKATNPIYNDGYVTGIGTFSSTGKFNVEGNIMSMLYGDDAVGKNDLTSDNYVFFELFASCTNLVEAHRLVLPATALADSCYNSMFYNCTSLTTAPELPATTLTDDCYQGMFYDCTGLTAAPELPATTLAQNCYNSMFQGCTSLTTAPELPATTLADDCYSSMFAGCKGLTTAPELPATTLADGCYYDIFAGCTGLTAAPELPATTLVNGCYSSMFYGCSSLTTAPELPATTLAYNCYSNMFAGCKGLTTAPELPATTLAKYCYRYMFKGCTSLTTAPGLPATTLADSCYDSMFYDCTGLTAAPELPATTLADDCYSSMFSGCTGLTTAPELPATTLAKRCYSGMFGGCTSLTTAPELPATTLTDSCYNYMFYRCSSLTTVPELPATALKSRCYNSMFSNCTLLNNIVMLATDISASSCLENWVDGVASTGTFTKHKDMTSLPTGASGIPSGWEVIDYQ